MSKLVVIGMALVILVLIIWVLWGEVIAARLIRPRRLDDEGLRER
jgi:Na+-transporting methylmalonyl-CoA/oxaloacetate decarboxylase gamma subunit